MSHSVVGWDKAGFEAAGPPFNEGVARPVSVGRHSLRDLVPPYESQNLCETKILHDVASSATKDSGKSVLQLAMS